MHIRKIMNRKFCFIVLCLIVNFCVPFAASLVEMFRWKWLKFEGVEDTQSTQINIIPFGASHHRGRFFITIPRRSRSVPYTLTYININEIRDFDKSPVLKAFPDVETNVSIYFMFLYSTF